MKKDCKTFYGGQALLEGVMMKGKKSCGCAVRDPAGKIVKVVADVSEPKDKCKFLGWPFIRGIVNFISMMSLAMKTLTFSAEVAGLEEEEEPTKFEKWLTEKFGKSIMDIAIAIASFVGVAIALLLFMYLPAQLVKFGSYLMPDLSGFGLTVIEGITKILIFIGYIVVISKMKEIKRTFEYHGAEHKTIHCFEHGEELTVENIKKYPTQHPRCGTSFITLVLVVSILVFSFLTWDVLWQRILFKILLLPVVMGISYELLKISGKYENVFTKILSYPGKLMQALTAKEPDAEQIECAVMALKIVLDYEGERSYPEAAEALRHGFEDKGVPETGDQA